MNETVSKIIFHFHTNGTHPPPSNPGTTSGQASDQRLASLGNHGCPYQDPLLKPLEHRGTMVPVGLRVALNYTPSCRDWQSFAVGPIPTDKNFVTHATANVIERGETDFWFWVNQPKSECIYHYTGNFSPNGVLFGSKSIGKG